MPRPALLVCLTLLTPMPSLAANDAPVVNLTYEGVADPGEFAFAFADRGAFAKSAGRMRFDLAPGALPAGGVGPGQVGYCCDPLTPIVAGRSYPFAVDSLADPKHYGLPDDFAGRERANRRAASLKELYGRNYQAVLDDPAKLSAAFQVAVWEVIQEPDLPGGAAPKYDLFDGQFKTSAKNVESAPAFVQEGQKFVTGLTGDATQFAEADGLRRLDLVRLTGVAGADGVAAQSQIALVPAQESAGGGTLAAVGPGFAPGLPAVGGLGGGGGAGGFPAFAPARLGGGGGGRRGGGGSALRSSPGLTPVATPVATPQLTPSGDSSGTFDNPGGRSPQTEEFPPTPIPPSGPLRDNPPEEFGPPPQVPPPGDTTPATPPSDSPPPESPPAVPAPPALALGLVGVGLIALRRWRRGR